MALRGDLFYYTSVYHLALTSDPSSAITHTWIVYRVSTNKSRFLYGTNVGICFSAPPCNFTHGLGLFWIEVLQHIFYSRPQTHFQEGIPTVTPHHHVSTESAKVTVPELQQEEHAFNKLIFSALLSVLGHWDCRHIYCKLPSSLFTHTHLRWGDTQVSSQL